MRLYYYTAKQWGMKSLWERRLKIAEYADLNDPFELMPFQQSEEDRASYKQIVAALSQNHGVLCFSESWESTLMWAHYGDKHKGLCLGFDIPEGEWLTKIQYEAELLPSPLGKGVDRAMLIQCLNIKHSGWEYEREYRLRASLNDQRDGIYYSSFHDGMELREVIIGARSSLSIVDVAEAIGAKPESSVDIWTARAAYDSFKMCVDPDRPRETIKGDPGAKERRRLAEALLRHVGDGGKS